MKEVTIKVPEGVDRFTVILGDGYQLVTNEKENNNPYGFKDGDILASDAGTVVIYAGTRDNGEIITYTGYETSDYNPPKGSFWGKTAAYRPATAEEKCKLFGTLAKDGFRWNAEKKELEKIPRWRANTDQTYFVIDNNMNIVEQDEDNDNADERLYQLGNYFRTKEAAEKVAKQIREIFKNSKAE